MYGPETLGILDDLPVFRARNEFRFGEILERVPGPAQGTVTGHEAVSNPPGIDDVGSFGWVEKQYSSHEAIPFLVGEDGIAVEVEGSSRVDEECFGPSHIIPQVMDANNNSIEVVGGEVDHGEVSQVSVVQEDAGVDGDLFPWSEAFPRFGQPILDIFGGYLKDGSFVGDGLRAIAVDARLDLGHPILP